MQNMIYYNIYIKPTEENKPRFLTLNKQVAGVLCRSQQILSNTCEQTGLLHQGSRDDKGRAFNEVNLSTGWELSSILKQ